MYLGHEDLYKILILINAQNKGWKIGISDEKTFYLIKDKNDKDKSFVKELIKLSKKPINLEKELNELINKKNL
tara:strand:- start:285 stop:503 length:219 start_codon:yes stop_codon:yes gene_type:complete